MLIYTAVETAVPGSFRFPEQLTPELGALRSTRGTLGYFSFVTLATEHHRDDKKENPWPGCI